MEVFIPIIEVKNKQHFCVVAAKNELCSKFQVRMKVYTVTVWTLAEIFPIRCELIYLLRVLLSLKECYINIRSHYITYPGLFKPAQGITELLQELIAVAVRA